MTASGQFTIDGTGTGGADVTVLDTEADPPTVVGTDTTASDGTWSVDIGSTTTIEAILEYEDPDTGEVHRVRNKPYVAHEAPLAEPVGDPLAWWPTNEGSGDTVADNAGSFDGTRNGASWVTDSSVWIGDHALSYDGVDDYTEVPHDSALNVANGDFTLCATVGQYTTGSGDDHGIVNKYQIGGSRTPTYGMYESPDNTLWRFRVRDSGGTENEVEVDFSAVSAVNGNYRFVGVREGDTNTFYVNGTAEGSNTTAVGDTSNTDPLNIGRFWTDDSIDAVIDDVILYDYALTEQEVSDDYARQPWSP